MPSSCESSSSTTVVTSTLLRLDGCSRNRHYRECCAMTRRRLHVLTSSRCVTRMKAGNFFVLGRKMKGVPRGSRLSTPLDCNSCCFVRTLLQCQGCWGREACRGCFSFSVLFAFSKKVGCMYADVAFASPCVGI